MNPTQTMEDVERLRTLKEGGLTGAAGGGWPQKPAFLEGERTFVRPNQVSL